MKIKSVAVTFQNRIQYDSFINAVDIMIERGINVDIYIPIEKKDKGFSRMFEEFFALIDKKKYKVYREITNNKYDILFEPYPMGYLDEIQRKYTIKYMYGLTTKPKFSLSLKINNIFDAFLCYGEMDAECLSNYGMCFQIGNIKYLNTQIKKKKINSKPTILYLPTYGKESSIDVLINPLIKLKEKFKIIVKPHHGTEYLEEQIEKTRMKNLKDNFENLYSSKEKLENLINECDIIISDMSGAVFDGICLKKPVIMYYNKEDENYGEYISLPVQIAKNNSILSLNNNTINNLEELIKKGLTKQQKDRQNKIYKKLFCCEINETKKEFIAFLNKIESGIINESYYLIHQNIKKEIFDLYLNNNNLNYENYLLKDMNLQLKESSKIYETRNLYLEDKLNKIYNSTSWKITKPLRKFKDIINKLVKQRCKK